MKDLLVAVRALSFATCFISLWAWVALLVEAKDARLGARLPNWTAVPGLVAMAAGAVLTLTCIALFVAVGPYRFVRNPMYVGGFAVLAGWALYRHSPSVLLLAAAWLALVHLFVVAYEEPTLRTKFGPDYERYKASVPRWLPAWPLSGQGRPATGVK